MKQGTDPDRCIKILKREAEEKKKQVAQLSAEIKQLHKEIQIIEYGYPAEDK